MVTLPLFIKSIHFKSRNLLLKRLQYTNVINTILVVLSSWPLEQNVLVLVCTTIPSQDYC